MKNRKRIDGSSRHKNKRHARSESLRIMILINNNDNAENEEKTIAGEANCGTENFQSSSSTDTDGSMKKSLFVARVDADVAVDEEKKTDGAAIENEKETSGRRTTRKRGDRNDSEVTASKAKQANDHTSQFNVYLQKTFNQSVGDEMFWETYALEGPAHEPKHRCRLKALKTELGIDHEVVSDAFVVKKDAKKDACRLMHLWFVRRQREQTEKADGEGWLGAGGKFLVGRESKTERSVNAMIGDAALRLMLALQEDAPKNDPGTLHDWIGKREGNLFLFSRYRALDAANELPPGLPKCTGQHAVPTTFEAWIGRTFLQCGFDLAKTSAIVMPLLGESGRLVENTWTTGKEDEEESL